MSIVFFLQLLLVLFSFHACDARSFGVLRNETSEEALHSISKENEKLNRVSIEPNREASIPNNAKRDIAEEESNRSDQKAKLIHSEPNHEHRRLIDQAKGARVKVSGTKKIESVAWRVPHKKGGEPEARFNLDYLPPKTHPPVHN